MKYVLLFVVVLLANTQVNAQIDSLQKINLLRNKISFGRSQHIQYLGNNKIYKTNTLFNKAYYAAFAPIQFRGFKPFLSLSYEYFFTRTICYTCLDKHYNFLSEKQLHFINYATLGVGFNQELSFKTKAGKEIAFIFGASIERYLFKKAFVFNNSEVIYKVTPFTSSNNFFNQYFFKDLYGVRVYNASNYKVFIQISGVLLRNERLNYAPSRYTFHNFMLGFNVFFKS